MKSKISMLLVKAGSILAVCAGAALPAASDDYPTRTIELIVPFAAGGSTDLIARLIGEGLSNSLSRRVIVINRPGANTNIGTLSVIRAEPDGHTLLLSSIGLAANPSLYKPVPFDPETDLAPISLAVNSPTLLVVHPTVTAPSIAAFVAALKERPGALNYASYGRGSGPHLAAELFQAATGTRITNVPFAGGGPATIAVAGGHVHMLFAGIALLSGLSREGLVKPVGLAAIRRSPMMTDVPIFREAGIDYVTGTWFGLLAPARTSPAIIERLHRETVAVLRDPAVEARINNDGGEVIANSPAEFSSFIKEERRRLADVIAKAGIQ